MDLSWLPRFDGNRTEVGTLCVAVTFACWGQIKAKKKRVSRAFAQDLFDGALVLPLLLLVLSTFSSELLHQLTEKHQVIMGLAGVLTLQKILADFFGR